LELDQLGFSDLDLLVSRIWINWFLGSGSVGFPDKLLLGFLDLRRFGFKDLDWFSKVRI
jgi:hypothetical protein